MSKPQHIQLADTYELLSTKLTPPRLSSSRVSRERLLVRLDEGLECKLTLLSAPAGFGKTTLVSEWMVSRSTHPHMPPVAWVSLDAGDNDPVRFWSYIFSACQTFHTAIGRSAFTLLHASQQPPLEAVLTTFINELTQLPSRGVLVLEDYHFIISPQIHETVAFLLDHLPATLHLIMITRNDPPLPLARLRAHNDLNELHATDLRFSLAETQTFLQQTIAFSLSDLVVTRLEARTEGWVTGLRLVALALQGRQEPHDIESLLVTFTGSHRHILEYLVADVLSLQPESLQEFLLQTTILSRLTGSLCDAVTGRNDSELLLEQLERANLFLLPLDGTQQWYRYHALFAEAMQHEAHRRLGDAGLRSLSHKASLWYEEHGLFAEAIEAALFAQAFARAASLIESIIAPRSIINEIHTLRRWLEQLPEEVMRTHPTLCLAYAMALLYTSDRSAPATRALLQAPLEIAEQYWQAEGNKQKLGEVQAFRAQAAMWQRDIAQAFIYASQALALLPESATEGRGISMMIVGMQELLAGKLDTARQTVLEARTLCEIAEQNYGVRGCMFMLGQVSSEQGELHQAAELYRQVLAEAGEDLLDRAQALSCLAALSYEWNDLEAAEQNATQALEIGKQLGDEAGKQYVEEFLLVPASLVLARVLCAQGKIEQAQQVLHLLATLTQQRRWHLLHREVLACQTWLSWVVGDLAAVQRWATTYAQHIDDIPPAQQEQEALLLARMLIARGEEEAALRLLEHWQAEAHSHGRSRRVMEILVLKALALAHTDLPQARQVLREVLVCAQVEGYQRTFLDEGEALATLLRTVLSSVKEEPLAAYVRGLLLAFVPQRLAQDTSLPATPSSLIEPLSTQEQRVLRLLATGRSNPEIAAELIVSVNTVKTQVRSIYNKLNVRNRMEANEVARRLKLL